MPSPPVGRAASERLVGILSLPATWLRGHRRPDFARYSTSASKSGSTQIPSSERSICYKPEFSTRGATACEVRPLSACLKPVIEPCQHRSESVPLRRPTVNAVPPIPIKRESQIDSVSRWTKLIILYPSHFRGRRRIGYRAPSKQCLSRPNLPDMGKHCLPVHREDPLN